jgi:uncharacterized protein (TIGR00251 family)
MPDGLRVELRVQPGASRARIDGPARLDDGAVVLKVRVTEPPEGGKANAAVVKLLAKAWKVPKGALRVVAGAGARRKTVLVEGDPDALGARLGTWLAGLDERGG